MFFDTYSVFKVVAGSQEDLDSSLLSSPLSSPGSPEESSSDPSLPSDRFSAEPSMSLSSPLVSLGRSAATSSTSDPLSDASLSESPVSAKVACGSVFSVSGLLLPSMSSPRSSSFTRCEMMFSKRLPVVGNVSKLNTARSSGFSAPSSVFGPDSLLLPQYCCMISLIGQWASYAWKMGFARLD
ncbi:hypothetical protein SISSUDRAFT_242128 [Sistotremastrum suecicum HHB10207 ss-3]|uniref:Uncharacterized protein n=1 Tax=Sistotremastrum suecicum HHB10207 ss-3 TaxID=1314776 RepID=A0A166A113_9AGAM|nr:hypothetical protein SISSUDRAFT_242128 [Sistotremastrum suecicum HHB10207 ss-3]